MKNFGSSESFVLCADDARMQRRNLVRDKSYEFALLIVHVCRRLQEQKEFVLSRQLLRSGTSIGANIEEAMRAQSRRDFIAKLSISLKEAAETQYWLRLIIDVRIVPDDLGPLRQRADELISILTAILKTSKAE